MAHALRHLHLHSLHMLYMVIVLPHPSTVLRASASGAFEPRVSTAMLFAHTSTLEAHNPANDRQKSPGQLK